MMRVIQFDGSNVVQLMQFLMEPLIIGKILADDKQDIQVTTASGTITLRVGDWLIQENNDFRIVRANGNAEEVCDPASQSASQTQ